ncbi:hypothetical protein ACCI51_08160 [Microbulbifer echini]|uniref:Uncharacterized protein n=1 Tax=Microbulbifer echini TaxID=1529067 RepID=A0ABV4NNA8_9GAMM
MEIFKNILFFGIFLLSVSVAAAEGPFTTDVPPWARVSSDGSFVIYPIPASANCHDNKVGVVDLGGPDVKGMVLSLVLAAQMSGKKVSVWVDRYGSTTPQRCKIAFIEIDQ